ncbi:MAG: Uma2 family endonuclease [Sphingobacteriales bacterium]|nr:Uma2 family endonuclease [Sphingobacteriales bacterium]
MEITSLSQLDLTARYTYADYLLWQFSERVELIKGYIMRMSAPSSRHQRISFATSRLLGNFFYKTSCQVYHAPFDVRFYDAQKSLKADRDIYTVVQPDLCVICDKSKIDERGCLGAPDWIIEILSPGNSKKEVQKKYDLYEEHGVREYWVVYPNEQSVFQFVLNGQGKYYLHKIFAEDDLMPSYLFPDLLIDLKDVFED